MAQPTNPAAHAYTVISIGWQRFIAITWTKSILSFIKTELLILTIKQKKIK